MPRKEVRRKRKRRRRKRSGSRKRRKEKKYEEVKEEDDSQFCRQFHLSGSFMAYEAKRESRSEPECGDGEGEKVEGGGWTQAGAGG